MFAHRPFPFGEPVWTCAADLFADEDLAELCPALVVSHYPVGFLSLLRQHAPDAWMYSGGLENRPGLVDRMAKIVHLAGNPGHVLRNARNPLHVSRVLREGGFPAATTSCAAGGRRRRSVASQAGSIVCGYWSAACDNNRANHQNASGKTPPCPETQQRETVFFSNSSPGEPRSAVYVAAGGQASLCGVTRQLIGVDWCGAKAFRYAGSIGPFRLTTRIGNLHAFGQLACPSPLTCEACSV